MNTTNDYLQKLRAYKAAKASVYGISRIGIFGSVARGEHTEGSDIDVCVDLQHPSLYYMVHIKEELQQLFGCSVDVVRIREKMDSFFKEQIIKEVIYV